MHGRAATVAAATPTATAPTHATVHDLWPRHPSLFAPHPHVRRAGSYLTFEVDLVLVDFFTAYHSGHEATIYERLLRNLLTGGAPHALGPPAVMFVNFFEFADRHHASSTYDLMLGQARQSQSARNATRAHRDTRTRCAHAVKKIMSHRSPRS